MSQLVLCAWNSHVPHKLSMLQARVTFLAFVLQFREYQPCMEMQTHDANKSSSQLLTHIFSKAQKGEAP